MGSAPTGFDILAQAAPAAAMQRRQIAEQQRVESQNTVGAQLLDSINNASNIKPTTKDPDGNEIPNPAYAQAQTDKQKLLSQYVQLNSPEQHAAFGQRLHGLIFGTPSDGHQQPALSPNSSPVASTAQPDATAGGPSTAAAPPPPPQHPMAPLPADHPANKITEGLAALKNHLSAFAHPLPPPQQPDTAMMAQYYRDPGEVAAERNQALWGVRGQTAENVANIRKDALMASLSGRPPRLLSQTTIPDLLDQMKVDPSMSIYGPSGQELSPAQLAELPPGTIAREFRAGSQIFYALGDQNSKTLNVGGQIYQIPAVGGITSGNTTALGAATSTLPRTHSNASTDAFGNTTHAASTTQTASTPGITAPGPVSSAAPTLLRRPGSDASAAPPPPNPGARAPGTQPAGAAVKAKPISSAAPTAPGPLAPLDADGHIPAGTGNNLVRQYANNLLDGQDSKNIPNPGARAAAEALASSYGWSQGAFTPREKVQFQTATTFLKQLQDSDSLSVLNSFVSREKIARAMKDPAHMNIVDRIAAFNLDPKEAEFLRLYNAAVGTVQGLSSITRSGRSTETAVNRLKTELPTVFQSSSSADAKLRIDQLLKEANIALSTNPSTVGKKGPVSAAAPTSPGQPKIGDVKTFPNGRKGTWDGTGWVAQ